MHKTVFLITCFAVLAVSAMAEPSAKSCSPVGVWYGGSDYKYIITITPTSGHSFAMRGQGVYSNAAFGYAAGTSFESELLPVAAGGYVSYGIGMYTTSFDIQPPPDSFELDGIRGWATFSDCNHLNFSYDFFAAYFDLNKIPFIDPPDLDYLPPGGIQEAYTRMPTRCQVCQATSAPKLGRHHAH